MTLEAAKNLSRPEKVKLMEELWEDLSHPDSEFESPAWHANALAETERRVAEGKEQPIDWDQAKKELRAKFE